MKTLILAISIALTSCSSTVKQWYKQDATNMKYYQDINDCERQAGHTYPPSFYDPYQDPSFTTCYKYHDIRSCYTNPTTPIAMRIDSYTQARVNYATRCMFGKGYDLIDTSVDLSTKDGWCKKFPTSPLC